MDYFFATKSEHTIPSDNKIKAHDLLLTFGIDDAPLMGKPLAFLTQKT
jgi:hypothetical protein